MRSSTREPDPYPLAPSPVPVITDAYAPTEAEQVYADIEKSIINAGGTPDGDQE